MEVKKYSIDDGLARSAKAANSMRDYLANSATDRYLDYINDFERAVNDLIVRNARKPYPTWALTNNNAEIRRIKERIAEIERIKANAEKPIEDKYPHVDGVEVVENAEAMRIQLIFDGKPDDATRALLKSNGFRWSPSFGAWQRQLNGHGIYAAKAVLEKLKQSNADGRRHIRPKGGDKMARSKALKQAQKRYEASGVIRRKVIKLHELLDADIIAALNKQESVNGYIKELIRKDIEKI